MVRKFTVSSKSSLRSQTNYEKQQLYVGLLQDKVHTAQLIDVQCSTCTLAATDLFQKLSK